MERKKSGGKENGVLAAKKAKYQSHSAEAERNGKNTKNKVDRAYRHQLLLAKQQTLKEKRLDLLDQVKSLNKNDVDSLSRKYGTLNIRRLTEILNGTADDSLWYKARIAKKEAEAQACSAKVVRKHVKFRKKRKDEKMSSKVQEIHGGRNPRDRDLQVDSE